MGIQDQFKDKGEQLSEEEKQRIQRGKQQNPSQRGTQQREQERGGPSHMPQDARRPMEDEEPRFDQDYEV